MEETIKLAKSLKGHVGMAKIAKELGIVPSTLWRKMNGKSEFKDSERRIIENLLKELLNH